MKQTAVDTLIDAWDEIFGEMDATLTDMIRMKEAYDRAKSLEREQILDAWDKRGSTVIPSAYLEPNINGEEYYNKTYKK